MVVRRIWEDPDAWRQYHGGIQRHHPLFGLIAVSILNLVADPMHIIDLGVAHHIVGNVLFVMCYFPAYFPAGNNPSQRCDLLWKRVGDLLIMDAPDI